MSATTAHSLESEQALLGAMFLADDTTRAAIFGTVRREWFFKESHRALWDGMLAVERAGEAFDHVSIMVKLRDLETANTVGIPYMSTLSTMTPTAANWEFYADTIKRESDRRDLDTAAMMARHGFEGDSPIEAAGELVASVNQILSSVEAQTVYTSIDAARATVDMLQEAQRRHEAGDVVQWRMSSQDLSDVIPLMPGKMIVLAMRSGGGKTSAAANGAQMTAGAGESFGFHSVEMPIDEVNLRHISRVEDINELNCLKGQMGELDSAAMMAYLGKGGAAHNPLFITKPNRSIEDVERKVRHLYAVHGVRYHAVDYFQLLRSSQRFSSRADELNDIGQRLKQLTADLPGLALLVLAQMNKVWSGPTPRKEDIRYGSGLCDSADGVTLGYRPNRKMDDTQAGGNADDTIIFVNDKGRFGGEHTASFGWENGRIISDGRTYEQEMQHRQTITRGRA